jgi:hypothetical protein
LDELVGLRWNNLSAEKSRVHSLASCFCRGHCLAGNVVRNDCLTEPSYEVPPKAPP